MTYRTEFLARLAGSGGRAPFFVPDLTIWHKWHAQRDTLPRGWGTSLASAARALGVPAWVPCKPWQTQYAGVEWTTDERDNERIVRFRTPQGELVARWVVGPDGDWWQTEYPVKTLDDLALAREVVHARFYVLDDAELSAVQREVGDDGVIALELPMRPYSDVLHTLLGWGEGLTLMLGAGKAIVEEIMAALEEKLHKVAIAVAALPGDILLAPDNLDGQYISPRAFKAQLAPSYARTVELAQRHGKPLVVHVGGPAQRLAPLLAAAGVDAIEGIAGAPQSDLTLADARVSAGPDVTLWGGIPQDCFTPEWDDAAFETAVAQALGEAADDPRMILGVADRVPPDALVERLQRVARLTGG